MAGSTNGYAYAPVVIDAHGQKLNVGDKVIFKQTGMKNEAIAEIKRLLSHSSIVTIIEWHERDELWVKNHNFQTILNNQYSLKNLVTKKGNDNEIQ
jgi:hypothetical protein